MKLCSKCKESKPLKLFGNDKRRKDGKKSWCKSCGYKYRNKENHRAAFLKYQKSDKGKAAQHRAYEKRILKQSAMEGIDGKTF